MRGKELAVGVIRQHGGITPAHAGKRACTTTGTTRRKDHPRVCGEKTWLQLYAIARQGSPPHVRGKGAPGNVSGAHNGITPACAGKSYISGHHFCTLQDHPRMCGEKAGTVASIDAKVGSPPHVRGKVCMATGLRVSDGITPACAGKRESAENVGRAYVDHPRMCGEKD